MALKKPTKTLDEIMKNISKEKGFTPSLDKANQRKKEMEKHYINVNQHQKMDAVLSHSLWASGSIDFTFNDWKPQEHKNVQQARNLGNKAYILARQMVNGHLNVVMSGDAGVGKTSLALAMLDYLWKHDKQVLFVSVVALSQLMSDQYKYSDKEQQLNQLKRAMRSCDILLLDDLGADGGSIEKVNGRGYTGARKDLQELLFDVANNRYEGTSKERMLAKKSGIKLLKPVHQTIITTNNMNEELERIYGERTVSRLISKDPNHRLAFNGMEDMRPKEGI